MLTTVVAFVVALAILIAVHEYGHYRVAVACGVKVLRFSVGFGKPLLRWQKKGSSTEFVIGAIPLGGYVRMLDEREAPVAAEERHLAFNTQPLRSRAAIVAAGPIANLLLAIVLYACVNWIGVREPAAFVGAPPAQSLIAKAGLQGGEQVLGMALDGDETQRVRSLEDLRWFVAQAALNGGALAFVNPGGIRCRRKLMEKIGLAHPWSDTVLGDFETGGAAEKSQLRQGDKVLQIRWLAVQDARQLAPSSRLVPTPAPCFARLGWGGKRNGESVHVPVAMAQSEDQGKKIGRLGAYIGSHQHGASALWPVGGSCKRCAKDLGGSALTVEEMMAKMVMGQASLQNISGPLTIAEYAGKSAQVGLTQYIAFLALISVSLGVLNLLPLPLLDWSGTCMLIILWGGVTRTCRPTVQWLERLQKGGVAVLLLMM
ncbi:hypothetical protein FQA39_LY19228 [Lamprigera yunnana]|nr:hypothetical protein FQA39_LY19228 [Lamprigera yunnana]